MPKAIEFLPREIKLLNQLRREKRRCRITKTRKKFFQKIVNFNCRWQLKIIDATHFAGVTSNVRFSGVQKGVGRAILLENFPTIQVESPIYHIVSQDDLGFFQVGMDVNIKIDLERRAKLTVSHSGLHVVLMGIEKLRPGITKKIVGCHITTEYARIDFSVGDDKFNQEELHNISEFANEIIGSDEVINVFHHPKEEEAWYWQCRDTIIPCGGTHLLSAKYIGEISLKRKNLGKNAERIVVTFPNAQYCLSEYCEE